MTGMFARHHEIDSYKGLTDDSELSEEASKRLQLPVATTAASVSKENQVQCKMLKGDWTASKEDLGPEHQDFHTESIYHHVVAEKPIFWPRKDHVMEPVVNGPTAATTEVKSEVPAAKHDSLADLKVNFYCDCCKQQFYKRADFDNHKSASGHNKCVNQSKLSESCFKTEVKTRKELRELEKEKSKFLNSGGSLISSANKFAKITVKEERESTLPQNDDGEQTSGQLTEDISGKEQELSKQNESQRGKEIARKRLKAFSQFRSTSPKAQEDATSQKSSQITFTLTKKSRLSSYDQHPPTKESKIKSVVVKPLNTGSEQKKHIIHKPKEEHLECDNNENIVGVEETLDSEVLLGQSKVKTKEEVVINDIKVSIGNTPKGNLTIETSQCQTIAQESETSGNEQKDGSNQNQQGSEGGNNKKDETNGKAADNNASGAANSSDCSGDNTATNGGSGDGDDNEDKDKKITSGGGSIDGKNGNAEEDGDGNDKSGKVNEEVNDTVGKEWKPCPKDGFLPVINKDDSTILQWPLDMVSYTKAEPSICYSCNPLHFEFRKPVITKENENIDGEVENKIEDVNLGNPNQPKNPVTLLLPRQVVTKQAAQNKENNVSNPDALAAETSVEKKAKKSKKKKKKSGGKKAIDGVGGEKTNSSKHKSKKKGSRKRKRDKSKESKSGDKESSKHSHHSGDNYSDYSDDDHYSKRRRSKSSSKDKSRKRHHSFSSEDRSSDEEYRAKKSRRSGSRKDDDDYENRSRSSRDRSRRYSSDSDSDRSRSRSRRSRRRSRSRSYSRSYSRSRSRSRSRSHSRSPRSSRGSSDRSGKSGNKELREALKEQARANAAGKTVPLKEKKGGITAAGIQQQIAAGGHTIPTTTTIISDMDTKKESVSGQKQTNASNTGKGEVKNKVDSNSLNSDLHENYPENADDKNYEDFSHPEGLSEDEIQRRKEFFKKPGAPAPKAKRPVAYPHSVAAALYNIQNPEEISHELHEGASTSSSPVASEDQSVMNAEEESASTIKEMIPPEDIEKYRRLQEQARLHVQQKMIASGEIPPPPPPEAQAAIERDVMSPSQQSVLLQNHPHLIGISRDGEVLHQAIGSPLLSQTGFAQAHLVQHHQLHRHATSPGPHTPSPPPSHHMLPAGVVPASFASLRTNLHPGTLPIGSIPVGAIPTSALHAGFPTGAIPAGALQAGAIHAGSIPTSAIQPGAIPAGAIPAGALPAGAIPAGAFPAGAFPSGAFPAGAYPAGAYPAGAFPAGAFPAGAFPAGAFPAGAFPAGAIPAGAIRVGGIPAGAIPAGSIPAGAVQTGSLPPGAIPLGIIPQGALPGGAVHASAIQRPGVPRLALPPGAVVVGGMTPGMHVPMEAMAAPRILQAGALPRGAIPASAFPKGVVKAGSLPRGVISVASLPRGAIPSESLPHGIISSSALQHGLIPARTIQAGGIRPGSIPSKVGALPQGLIPAGAIPRGLIQAGGMPVGSLPHGAFHLEALQRQMTPGRHIPGAVQVPMGSQVRMIMPGRPGLVPAAQGRYPGAYPQLAVRSGVLQQHPGIFQHNPGGIISHGGVQPHFSGVQPHFSGFQPHPGMTHPQRFPMPQQNERQVQLPNLVGKPLIKTAPPKNDGDRT